MKRLACGLVVSVLLLSACSSAHADLLAEWVSFSSLPASATGGVQQGTAQLNVEQPSRGSFQTFAGADLLLSGNGRGWEGAALELAFSGDLYYNFVLSFDVTGIASGGRQQKLPPEAIDWYLSADGSSFALVGTNSIGVGANNGVTLSLAGNPVANTASSLVLRGEFVNPDSGSGPALVFDNFQINAVAVPEPSAVWFFSLAGVFGSGWALLSPLRRRASA
jgi:hypothetical protein